MSKNIQIFGEHNHHAIKIGQIQSFTVTGVCVVVGWLRKMFCTQKSCLFSFWSEFQLNTHTHTHIADNASVELDIQHKHKIGEETNL